MSKLTITRNGNKLVIEAYSPEQLAEATAQLKPLLAIVAQVPMKRTAFSGVPHAREDIGPKAQEWMQKHNMTRFRRHAAELAEGMSVEQAAAARLKAEEHEERTQAKALEKEAARAAKADAKAHAKETPKAHPKATTTKKNVVSARLANMKAKKKTAAAA